MRANTQTIWNLSGDVAYRGPEWKNGFDAQSYFNFQDSVATVSRNSMTLSSARYLGNGWSMLGVAGLAQNDELSLDFRSTFALTASSNFVQTTTQQFEGRAGLAASP